MHGGAGHRISAPQCLNISVLERLNRGLLKRGERRRIESQAGLPAAWRFSRGVQALLSASMLSMRPRLATYDLVQLCVSLPVRYRLPHAALPNASSRDFVARTSCSVLQRP